MWGLHDHSLILRTALHRLLTKGLERVGLKRRWKYQTQLRNDQAGGLTFTEEEWEFEWGEVLRIATNKPRRQPITDSLRRHSSLRFSYESLEEVHISALAHTLRRPVIVLSDRTIKDMSGQDLAPIYFGGIYLPLEVNPTACYKSPVVLAYDSSHFSPLVAMQECEPPATAAAAAGGKSRLASKYARATSRKETVIPLVSPDSSLLPVQFVYDPQKKDVKEKWGKMEYPVGEFPDDIVRLLESYMNIRWIQLPAEAALVSRKAEEEGEGEDYDHLLPIQVPKVRFPAASIAQEAQPIYQKELVEKYLEHIKARFQEEKEARARREAEREEEEQRRLRNVTVPCEGEGCDMFGRPATNNLCSVCYQKALLAAEWEREEEREVAGEEGVRARDEPDVSDQYRSADVGSGQLAHASHGNPRRVELLPDLLEGRGSQREHVFGSTSPDSSGDSPTFTYYPQQQGWEEQDRNAGPAIPQHAAQGPHHHHQHQQSRGNGAAPISPSRQQQGAAKQALLPRDSSISSKQQQQTTVAPKEALAPVQTNVQREGGALAKDTPTALLQPARSRGHTPDENRPKSPTPTPPNRQTTHSKDTPALSPSKEPSTSSKGAVPISPAKSKAAQPPNSGAPPPKTGKGEQNAALGGQDASHVGKSSSSTPNWVSNLIFKKKSSPPSRRGGKYSRDNIVPLHLESPEDPQASDSGSSAKGARKKCKKVSCEFYGTPDCAGYCSSCYKTITKNRSAV